MPASARLQDQNGYLFVKGCPVASSGIFQYSAAQVGLPGEPNRIVNVYRPPEAVSDPEYIASLNVIPLINDHEMLSGFAGDTSAMAPEDYGLDGVLFDVAYTAPWVTGDLKIFTRSMQADLQEGKKDLSLGYTCDFEVKGGTADGQSFEVIQTNMRGNHIALVEVGRVPGARVLDGKRLCFDSLSFSSFTINGGQLMAKGATPPKKRALDANVAAQLQVLLKQMLPVFEQFMGQEAAEPEHQDPNAAGAAAQGGEANAAAAGQEGAQAAGTPAAAVDPNAGANAGNEAASAANAQPGAGGETGTGEVAATGATAQGGAEGEQGEGEEDGEGNAAALVSQIMELMKQLSAALGGGGEAKPAPAAEGSGDEGGEATGGESTEGANGEASTNGAESTEDTVEGLEGTAREGADTSATEGGQGTASPGPAAGKHTGADAALRRFYDDAARKATLVDRLSKVVGTFDGALDIARSTAADVAAYGCKSLKITCAKGQEVIALDAYLTAHAKGRLDSGATEATDTSVSATSAVDSGESPVSAYFKKVS
jgi:uncharacterized protein